ncbi:MAG TPA: 3'-5' exonuclease [Candidatus Ozemobacteraceae bacterium]|nr:3'-5' exonuclease [Candidatus Ozemobacteraceae bacterium]
MRQTAPCKAETELLEPFDGIPADRISTPSLPEQFASAVAEIRSAGVVGFDTETKPVFAKGVVRPGPDIVQFATENKAFIFQLQRPECRPFLAEILCAADVLKVGFDLREDRALLRRWCGLEAKAVLDLGSVFRKKGYRNTVGVRAAVGIVLRQNFRKAKHVTTSDWSRLQLSSSQLAYAANDAYAALKVWAALERA